MSTQPLDQPISSASALRSVNFFNGRLLTGDDLTREQATQEARVARLARAVGDGVAYGLEIGELLGTSTAAQPAVTVAPGLAISRSGVALELTAPVDISLQRSPQPPGSSAEPFNLFADCQPAAPGTYTAGAGVYLLVIGPAQRGEGRARASGLTNTGPCTVSLSVETVAFRLIRLALVASQETSKDLLRNQVAYACFGVSSLADRLTDPFAAPPAARGLLDTLRTQTLSDDEVPLATIGWSSVEGIRFIDMWSVRRRPTRAPQEEGSAGGEVEADWAELAGERRRAEAEAMYLQFQEHLGEVLARPLDQPLIAALYFDRLPPVGLLPLAAPQALRPGVDIATFFHQATTRGPLFIEGAKAESLLRGALAAPSIAPASGEMIWLYRVREAVDPREWLTTPGGPYVLFTSGFIRYAGAAQFDLSRWSYANLALRAD